MAADLHGVWACSVEVRLKTFQDEKQLRLHGHLYLKARGEKLRCEHQKKLRFQYTDPHLVDSLWGRQISKSNWAGAHEHD